MKIILSIMVFISMFGAKCWSVAYGSHDRQRVDFQRKADNVLMGGESVGGKPMKLDSVHLAISDMESLDGYNMDLWMFDKTESEVGVHVLSSTGKHTHISNKLTWELIRKELHTLDWHNNFYQFIVVTDPGVSMEVGGSMNGIDGLSAMYRNRQKRVDAVIKNPPESVYEMEKILEEFLKPNNIWVKKYDFEFTSY